MFAGPINNVTVNVGREAVLECHVDSLGQYKVLHCSRDSSEITKTSVRWAGWRLLTRPSWLSTRESSLTILESPSVTRITEWVVHNNNKTRFQISNSRSGKFIFVQWWNRTEVATCVRSVLLFACRAEEEYLYIADQHGEDEAAEWLPGRECPARYRLSPNQPGCGHPRSEYLKLERLH